MFETPAWNICVVTTRGTDSEYRSIKNSLLYADHTHWISLEVAFDLWERFRNLLGDALSAKGTERFRKRLDCQPPAAYLRFNRELLASGAGELVTAHFDPAEAQEHLFAFMADFNNPEKRARADLAQSVRQAVAEAITDSRVFACQTDFFGPKPQNWNTYNAAHELMMSVSRLLLPDVSALPVGAVVELRSQLQDSLDPVRAELLRLTEDLRKFVTTAECRGLISTEADNLIATRVEPLVRDANRRANELLDRKWRKLLAGAAKAFGFAGAGFVDPKLFAKAVQQCLETSALALADVEDEAKTLKVTSQFVLQARNLASGI